ncbi:amidohydrolase family protein [Streptosporangium sp. NBC_01495]|uniref:amidohydrolase family protein n=1 Tax=Streptosporangium sp. NBC_01495 TaxID=2903899 RepID=UPI002E373811|nr:amidohydrolase family protein [Streptosporangium sp. NBC_01495]
MTLLAIHAGLMFDGTNLSGPTTVFVEDGRITGVDTTGALPLDGADLIDLGVNAFLMPGLVDPHVHLGFDAGPDPVTAFTTADDAELLARMRAAADRALQAGITTVRDLGDRNYLALALRAELDRRPGEGPEILAAGPPITTPGGHCHFMGGAAEGAAALRAAVRDRHERGCAVVKIMLSGGNMTPGSPPHESQYSSADLRAVVDEAHRLGLPVAAHAHGTPAIRDALAAGVDSIEHATFVTADGVDADPALLAALAGSDVFVSVTIGVVPGDSPLVLPPEVARRVQAVHEALRSLYRLGARIVLGTDAGIMPVKPHDVLPYAVSQFTAEGPSPLEALTAATGLAAQACGVSDRKGRIAVGADADLLAVTGNPLDDLDRLRDVRAVFRAGFRVR